MKITRLNWIIILLAVIKFIFPFILQSPAYEPHRDELLYLAEGNHLAWGYMEVPPLLSAFAWLTNLLGGGMFWIKFWPSLFGAFTFVVVARIVLLLGGRAFAVGLAFLPFVFGVLLRIHFLFQPNFLEVFFWTLLAYSAIAYIQTQQAKWLYLFGISAGLGMLSKYSVGFFIVSILAGLLLTRQRKIFLTKHFWLASLLGLVIFLPNILWQFGNHLPVVFHMKELQRYQLQYVDTPSFLIDQILMNLPCVFLWIAGLWFAGFTRLGRPFRFIAWAYLLLIVLLIVLRGKNYYSIGAYPTLFALGAVHLERFTAERRKYVRYALVAIAFLIAIPLLPAALPIASPPKLESFYKAVGLSKTDVVKWEDLQHHPLPQDFSDMLGWKEMAEKMAVAYHALDSNEKKQTILFCDNYGQAGAINFYGKQYHLPEAYSDNASFLYWLPDTSRLVNIILLTEDQREMERPFIKNFSAVILNDSITTPYARERGDLIITLKGANEAFNQMFKEKIAKDKAQFNY